MGPDGTEVLDQRTRRLICEACELEPATLPQIVGRMRERGWKGSTGSLWTTVETLVQKGYLRQAGTLSRGKGRPSPLFQLLPTRRAELHAASLRNAAHRVEAGDELLLVPVGRAQQAASVLRAAGREVTWAMRTGDSAVGLVVVLSPRADAAVRDRLLDALEQFGVQRIAVTNVLDRPALDIYCDTVLEGPAVYSLPDTT